MVEGWKIEIVFYKVEALYGTVVADCKISFTVRSQKIIKIKTTESLISSKVIIFHSLIPLVHAQIILVKTYKNK